METLVHPTTPPEKVVSTSPEFYSIHSTDNYWSCGMLSCNFIFILTNCLVWFSLIYSITRLTSICHFLLHHSEDGEEGEDLDHHPPPPTSVAYHRGHRKHCLWEIAGMILISYEAILSFVLCIGTGSFVFEVKGFFVLMWCLNYPVFLMLHWVLGFFLTKCCIPQHRMKRSTLHNCAIVVVNIVWRGVLYWCTLNLLFHPKIHPETEDMDLGILKSFSSSGVRPPFGNGTEDEVADEVDGILINSTEPSRVA